MLYAEDINYWQTSKASSDTWIEKAKREIVKAGGQVLGEAFAYEPAHERQAYMLQFMLGEDFYKIVWPVLPSKGGNVKAARVQATTMMYHDIKARCVSAKVLGLRTAFLSWLMLPDGRTASEATSHEIAELTPVLLAPQTTSVIMLADGDA